MATAIGLLSVLACRSTDPRDTTVPQDTTDTPPTNPSPTPEYQTGTVWVHLGPNYEAKQYLAIHDPAGRFVRADLLPESHDAVDFVLQDVPVDGSVSFLWFSTVFDAVSIVTVARVQPDDELWLDESGWLTPLDDTLTVEVGGAVPTKKVDLDVGCGTQTVAAPSSADHIPCVSLDGSVSVFARSRPDDGSLPSVSHRADVPITGEEPYRISALLNTWNDTPGAVRATFDGGVRDPSRFQFHLGAHRSELQFGSVLRSSWVDGEDAEGILTVNEGFHDRVVVKAKLFDDQDPESDALTTWSERSYVVSPPKDGSVTDLVLSADDAGFAWTDVSFDPSTGTVDATGADETCGGLTYDMVRLDWLAYPTEDHPFFDWTIVGPADMPLTLPAVDEAFGIDWVDPTQRRTELHMTAIAFDGATYSDIRTHPLLFNNLSLWDEYAPLDVHDGTCAIHASLDLGAPTP